MHLIARLFIAIAALVVLTVPAHAQGPSTSQQQQAIATLAAVGQHVYIDGADVNVGAVNIMGWAFECASASDGTVDVLIDGRVVADAIVYRMERRDVWEWASSNGICPGRQVVWYSGVNALVDLAPYAPGLHTASLQIRNAAGVATQTLKPLAFIK